MAVTHLSGLEILPTAQDIKAGNFFSFPQLTQAQIDSIPIANLREGIVVYNTDHLVYMCYIDGSWNNLNSSIGYKGAGFDVGSPLGLPAGPRSVVEADVNNQIEGVIYIDTEHASQPRIYINGGWQDVAVSGGGSPTYSDLNVTGTTTTNILHVTTDASIGGDITCNTIEVATTATTNILDVTTTTNTLDLAVTGSAEITKFTGTSEFDSNFTGTFDSGSKITILSTPEISNIIVGDKVGVTVNRGMISGIGGTTPMTSISYGSAAGTGATGFMHGSPMSGIFTLNTGTGCTGTTIATFTLPNTVWQLYSYVFGVTFTPSNALTYEDAFNAKVTISNLSPSTSSVAASFVMTSGGSTQLQDTHVYSWWYMIVGNVDPVNL